MEDERQVVGERLTADTVLQAVWQVVYSEFIVDKAATTSAIRAVCTVVDDGVDARVDLPLCSTVEEAVGRAVRLAIRNNERTVQTR